MKIFIRTIQVVTALVLTFFSIGVFKESFSYQVEVTVNASADRAYTTFIDEKLTNQWLTGFVSIENVSGKTLTKGSQWRMTFEQEGNRFEMLETIREVMPGERFAFELHNEMMLAEVDVTFESQGDVTVIRANNVIKGKGILWRSLLPLMKGSIKERAQLDYAKLAAIIEKQK